ncbi:13381_t:CDS:2, partial [Funneliformis geosporum]
EIKGDKEYRRTYNEELFNKTGGREGRTYYCVPCVIKDCSLTISKLKQKLSNENVAGTVEDYKKIKSVQQRVKKLGSFEDLIIKGEIEVLKKTCQNLINEYISPKDRRIGDGKRGLIVVHSICCTPRDIKLEENDSEQYYYYKLNKKMLNNGISSFELNSLNYQSMLTVPDFLLTQEGIKDTYQKAEKDLEELLKKKGISIPQPNKKLSLQKNKITTLNLTDLSKLKSLNCGENQLTNLDFLNNLNLQELEELILLNNELPNNKDLNIFIPFAKLKILAIGSFLTRSKFIGSLKPLRNMNELKEIMIVGTDISHGLEYLPDSVEEFICFPVGYENKINDIYEELQSFGGDIKK